MRRPYILILASAALSACAAGPTDEAASAARGGARQCFWASQVTGFSDAGPDRALLNLGVKETWELELSPGCPDVNWAMKIGIVSRGSQRICTGRPAELVIPSAGGRGGRSCLVRNIRKLSPQEAAAARGEKPAQ